jgi:hypothetical protein
MIFCLNLKIKVIYFIFNRKILEKTLYTTIFFKILKIKYLI